VRLPSVPHVLIVDDQEDNLTLLAIFLARAVSCTVREAFTGEQALALLRDPAEPLPCLIVLDWNMPTMNGAAVLAEICGDPELAVIPVVVFTADWNVDAPGALRVLEKPRGIRALAEIARRICNQTPAAPAYPGSTAIPKTA
jgi:CheY-like chemotaxis protein